jgi:hypothetical protein
MSQPSRQPTRCCQAKGIGSADIFATTSDKIRTILGLALEQMRAQSSERLHAELADRAWGLPSRP